MSWGAKAIMFLDFADGSARISELVDCPGVEITDRYFNKENKTKRTITFNGKEFDKIEDVVLAWEVKYL